MKFFDKEIPKCNKCGKEMKNWNNKFTWVCECNPFKILTEFVKKDGG